VSIGYNRKHLVENDVLKRKKLEIKENSFSDFVP
jgi:hypothetical protein